MPERPSAQQSSPAEQLTQLNQGINLYTDPTICNPKMWAAASNIYATAAGALQRARFANVITSSTPGYTAQSVPFTSLKFYAIPGTSNYLLGDVNGKLFSFDSGASYNATQRLNPYIDPTGSGSSSTGFNLNGPWSREILQNIVYEMNGSVKQAGRGPNAAIIESFGLDTPDTNPQVTLSAGNSLTLDNIQRSANVVTANRAAGFIGLGITVGSVINVINVTDTSFNGSFVLTSVLLTQLQWSQLGQNTGVIASGSVTTQITKSIGRSYAYAWENANKSHIGAPSPSTQFFAYSAQNGTIQCIEAGTVTFAAHSTNVVGTNTAFTAAWIGRRLYVDTIGNAGRIVAVSSPTSLTLDVGPTFGASNNLFQVYDQSATHLRLYATADGGANYFRIARNAWNPSNSTIGGSGLQFFDNANSEPPNIPFTTETSQLYNIPPPVGQFIKEYQGVLIVYGVPGAPATFFYSNQTLTSIGLQQESFAPLNQVTLPIQNASINGTAEFPGALIIWSDKQDMFRLTGLLTDNTSATATQQGAQIAALPYNLGCASPFAVALTPLGAIWLTSNAEVWLFTDQYAPRNIGRPIEGILNTISNAQLKNSRAAYYHNFNRNWFVLSISTNGSTSNNATMILDLDLLASNGQPSFFVFDMASNQPVWYPYSLGCPCLEIMYESSELIRLFVGATDLAQDIDYTVGFGTEVPVPNGSVTFHAWGNDSAPVIKRPTWLRFNTNTDPSQLALGAGTVLVPLASDSFVRANESPLNPAKWTIASGVAGDGDQIVSNLVEAQSLTAAGVEYYSGITWPANQYASVVVEASAGVGIVGVFARGQAGSISGYAFALTGPTGAAATVSLGRYTGGAVTPLASATTRVLPGDTVTLIANGSQLIGQVNGVTVLTATDLTYSAGSAGIIVNTNVSLSNAQAGPWVGGTFIVNTAWSFKVFGIDDDFYTFASPLSLTLTPGVNDSVTLGGNPNLAPFGSPFRTSQEMYRIGGVNFVMGRRIQFQINFPSAPGVNYVFRSIQIGFGPSPPR